VITWIIWLVEWAINPIRITLIASTGRSLVLLYAALGVSDVVRRMTSRYTTQLTNVWAPKLPTDVVTLCGACHTRVHDLVKNGTRLEKAHYSLLNRRRSKSYGSKRGKGWVKQLHDLCNYSLMENPGHVRDFLRQQGYMNPSTLAPTQLAFKVKLAKKRSDGVIWWDKTRYITLTRNYRRACKKQTRSGTRSCK
jgi:hypothetical protein